MKNKKKDLSYKPFYGQEDTDDLLKRSEAFLKSDFRPCPVCCYQKYCRLALNATPIIVRAMLCDRWNDVKEIIEAQKKGMILIHKDLSSKSKNYPLNSN